MRPLTDAEAWDVYPHHRRWFDKLDLSLRLGYNCGPCGTAPRLSGSYVVRPIYNLEGMGVGARKQWIDAGDDRSVEPGYFWCEWFTGQQHSVTYTWDAAWMQQSSWEGINSDADLSRFSSWRISEFNAVLPEWVDELADCGTINVEFVAGNIIEVHLRPSPDPDDAVEIEPVWQDDANKSVDIESFDDAGGFLRSARLGFRITSRQHEQ